MKRSAHFTTMRRASPTSRETDETESPAARNRISLARTTRLCATACEREIRSSSTRSSCVSTIRIGVLLNPTLPGHQISPGSSSQARGSSPGSDPAFSCPSQGGKRDEAAPFRSAISDLRFPISDAAWDSTRVGDHQLVGRCTKGPYRLARSGVTGGGVVVCVATEGVGPPVTSAIVGRLNSIAFDAARARGVK